MLDPQPMTPHHAHRLHDLYASTPQYFATLGTPVPSPHEVQREVELALRDPRRRLELLYDGPQLIGCLDYKLHYPARGDITINLLMIAGPYQSQGYGGVALRHFEDHLPAGTRRLLASVLGSNERAARFWQRHGFSFAIDARPVMEWYAKPVHAGTGATVGARLTRI